MTKCFACWHDDRQLNVQFRTKTILQFGKSWSLLANFILLNPGSSKPLSFQAQNEHISRMNKKLMSQVEMDETYFEFAPDDLMKQLVRIFEYSTNGGVIRIFNLFNMKNPKSKVVLSEYKKYLNHSMMFTPISDIYFGNAPIFVASGREVKEHDILKLQLNNYISKVEHQQLNYLSKDEKSNCSFIESSKSSDDYIESYHPSRKTVEQIRL